MSNVAPARSGNSSRMIWVQLLAGPVIWSVHFILSYMLTEAICRTGDPGLEIQLAGIPGLNLIVIVLTLLAVAAIVFFGTKAYRSWKLIDPDHRPMDELQEQTRWSEGANEFLYFSGFMLSALFGVATLMVGIPALFLQPC